MDRKCERLAIFVDGTNCKPIFSAAFWSLQDYFKNIYIFYLIVIMFWAKHF